MQTNVLPPSVSGPPYRLAAPIAVLGLLAWLGLGACKPVEISAPGKDSVVVTDSVALTITNNIEQDPQSLTFFLFHGDAVDIVNAVKLKKLGSVEADKSALVKVPVGTWKLAYETEAGVLIALQDYDGSEPVWVKGVFEKDRAYSLILATDGNRTVWLPTFETIPAI